MKKFTAVSSAIVSALLAIAALTASGAVEMAGNGYGGGI